MGAAAQIPRKERRETAFSVFTAARPYHKTGISIQIGSRFRNSGANDGQLP
jgi:hypothetical protein